MADVVEFPGYTRLPIPVGRVLDGAHEVGLQEVIVLGRQQDGTEYFAFSNPDAKLILWLLERLKDRIIDVGFD